MVLFTLATVAGLIAQPVEQTRAPHSTCSQLLAGDDEQIYRLEAQPGQVVEISIRETQGIAGILTVEQDGRAPTEVDFAKRIPAAKRLLVGIGLVGLGVIRQKLQQRQA